VEVELKKLKDAKIKTEAEKKKKKKKKTTKDMVAQ
jgi:hypothetical protein